MEIEKKNPATNQRRPIRSCSIYMATNTLKLHRNGAVGFIDWLDPLSCRIKVELVVEAGQIRAVLDNAFRERRKLCSGKRSAPRVFCFETTFTLWGWPLSVDLECKFHGHAMNPFRMLH